MLETFGESPIKRIFESVWSPHWPCRAFSSCQNCGFNGWRGSVQLVTLSDLVNGSHAVRMLIEGVRSTDDSTKPTHQPFIAHIWTSFTWEKNKLLSSLNHHYPRALLPIVAHNSQYPICQAECLGLAGKGYLPVPRKRWYYRYIHQSPVNLVNRKQAPKDFCTPSELQSWISGSCNVKSMR